MASSVPWRRKPDRFMRPQPIGVEAGNLAERLVTSAMRIAGEIVELLQLSEHGHADRGPRVCLSSSRVALFVWRKC